VSTRKKTRHHSRWRNDCDYRHKLRPLERAWLDTFIDEYYRAEFGETPLHDEDQRREIYDAQNAAQRDIVTASSADVREALGTSVSDRPSLRVRFYEPGDYPFARPPLRPDRLEVAVLEQVRELEFSDDEIPNDFNDVDSAS
jgi:hypothetical protein